MKRFYLSLLLPIMGLPIFAQGQTQTPNPGESLDFTVNGITYTILNEQEKTCQTKEGMSYLDYQNRKIVYQFGNSVTGPITIPATVQKPSDSNDGSQADNTYTVTAIGNLGFDKASSVTIENGVSKIGEFAFYDNTNLTSISIPESVTEIGRSAFYYCTALTSADLPSSLTTIGNYAFSYTGITTLNISGNVTFIGDNAFAYCAGLQSLTLPATVTQFGKSVFQGCTGLTSLTLQEGITSIPSGTFAGCNKLTEITIPSSVSSIGDNAFNCTGLIVVTSYPKTIPTISANSFNAATYSNATLYVYKTALSSYQSSSLWRAFSKIEAIPMAATELAIVPSTLNVNVGTSSQLSTQITPIDATDEVSWELTSTTPTGCVSLDENGLVTAKQMGTAIVTAKCGNVMAICNVVVIANPDEYVVINQPNQDIYIGDSLTLTALVFPSTIIPTITWSSSNPEVATIDPVTGQLTALSVGGTVITATNDNVNGTLAIEVKPIEAASITLDQENITLKVGENQTLSATISPDNTTYKNVTWDSNDPSVAVVADGVVTAMGVGTANIRAMVGQVTANCTVTVNPIEAESVVLSANEATLKIGQSLQLGATVYPDNTTDKTVEWISSNPACATVSMEGFVQSLALGTATITAICGNVSASCNITVSPIESEDVVLNYSALNLKVGNTQQLTATIYPENTTDKNLAWQSSAPGIATVDNGLVTAVAVGTAQITVTNGTKSATCFVTVDPILVDQLTLNVSSITVNVGTPYTLTASVMPENATDKTIQWVSLNPDIAGVTNGIVTGMSPGSTVITASSGSANASCTVTVLQPASSITLNKTNLELFVGDMFDLIETVMPANTTDLVSWDSSAPTVATVDNNGIVTALKSGTSIITVTCGNKTAACEVVVSDIAATSVVLDYNALNLVSGQSQQLVATVIPDNTTFPVVNWVTSDASVATVSPDGTVSAVSGGTATITATCGDAYGACVVTVTEPAVEEVILNYNMYSLKAAETVLLQVINPQSVSAEDIAWSSSDDKVASVSNDGLVTAIGIGEAVITASYNNLSQSCTITVIPTEAESVTLNVTELTMEIGDNYQLTAIVFPATTTDPAILWSSSNPDVVNVSESGELTALSSGIASIAAMCGNVYGVCTVTVLEEEIDGIGQINSIINDGYYRVYTVHGINVMTTKEKKDLERLNPGIYIIRQGNISYRIAVK